MRRLRTLLSFFFKRAGFIWIFSVIVFLIFTILFKAKADGTYYEYQSLIFLASVLIGSLSFIVFIITLFVSFARKIKLFLTLRKLLRRGILFIIASVLIVTTLIGVVVYTTPSRIPQTAETAQKTLCKRTEMYPMPPEFQRSLSLVIQRYVQKGDKNALMYQDIVNCVDIQFTDIHQYSDNTEGYFIFDTENSSLERLSVYVDASYTNYDDLTTAFLLSHELTHVKQFVEEITVGQKISCVDKEVEAFFQQLKFNAYLNEEEGRSITARAERAGNNNPQLQQLIVLLDYGWDAAVSINGGRQPQANKVYTEAEQKQYDALLSSKIRKMVVDIPEYQKQCEL